MGVRALSVDGHGDWIAELSSDAAETGVPEGNSWDDLVADVYNIYFGRDARLLPSTFTFGVELNGENNELALTPQIRKGLSRTGALAGAFGVRLPLNHRSEQGVTWVGYLLWEYLEPVLSRR